MAQAFEDARCAQGHKDPANCYYSKTVADEMGGHNPNDAGKAKSGNS